MNRFHFMMMCAAITCGSLYAQNVDAVVKDAQGSWNGIKANVLAAAEEMDDAGYSFVPGEGARPFGGWVGHVADAQANSCGAVVGKPTQLNAERGLKTKAELVEALKKSIELCDEAFSSTTAENYMNPVQSFRGPTPRISSLYGAIAHSQECYGSMAVYLRSKNEVPPSTKRMMEMRSKGKAK